MHETLLIVRGPIGVGKSSVSSALQRIWPNAASIVEPDMIKRMLDPNESSQWRRDIAHNASRLMVEQLLQIPRTVIIEAHTKYPELLTAYETIAQKLGCPIVNILLIAPLDVCVARARERVVPDIVYEIHDGMINDYYCNLDPNPGDLFFDTSGMSASDISESVRNHALEQSVACI